MADLISLIKAPHSDVFRRCKIKRRLPSTGLFESTWLDVSEDVKKWGSYKIQVDTEKPNKFSFANAAISFANDEGKYNPEDDELSLWFNYLSQQRTLVRIEAGYNAFTNTSGVWTKQEFPLVSEWDEALFDDQYTWDESRGAAVFTGIISGDINLSNKNEVAFTVRPLTQIFVDYPARNLTGWTSTGLTASQFITMLRDQTDGSSAYVFRPFFGDTTANWDISTTSTIYGQLNTSTAKDVINANVWAIIEKLAEAESFVPYVTQDGIFKFVSRASNSSATSYDFYGSGSFSSTYGNTIKAISKFGKKITRYYSRVQVKYRDEDTSTAYEVVQTSLAVSGTNSPWALGARSLEIQNNFIPTSTVAQTVAQTLFNEHSTLKNEVEFTTSFIPHLDILDRVRIFYDSPPTNSNTLWDQNDWADDATTTADDLFFERATGDAIRLLGEEFKFLSIGLNLDKFEMSFHAREV
jgi:hypothetical protein